jgi:hypothetical protein
LTKKRKARRMAGLRLIANFEENLERAKGFEPSTPTLARSCSTPELHPHPLRCRRTVIGDGRAMPNAASECNSQKGTHANNLKARYRGQFDEIGWKLPPYDRRAGLNGEPDGPWPRRFRDRSHVQASPPISRRALARERFVGRSPQSPIEISSTAAIWVREHLKDGVGRASVAVQKFASLMPR